MEKKLKKIFLWLENLVVPFFLSIGRVLIKLDWLSTSKLFINACLHASWDRAKLKPRNSQLKQKFKMQGMFALCLSMSLIIFCTSCKSTVASYKFVATSEDFKLDKASSYRVKSAPVSASDKTHWVLFYLPVYWNGSFKESPSEAVSRAVDTIPGGVALKDVTVYQTGYSHSAVNRYIPTWVHVLTLGTIWFTTLVIPPFIIYEQTGYVIEGKGVFDPSLANVHGKKSKKIAAVMGQDKKFRMTYVNDEEMAVLQEGLRDIKEGKKDTRKIERASKMFDHIAMLDNK